MERNHICLGIDLGTTNSCIAAFRDLEPGSKNPEIIENAQSQRTTPSVVTFGNNKVIVGINAYNARANMPDRTFYSVKRLIGRSYDDPHVQSDKKSYPYKVYRGTKGKPVLKVATERYNSGIKPGEGFIPIEIEPEQISALVLRSLKDSADRKTTKPTNNVVITVPANFNEYQRRATKDAALIAGLNPIDTISEPTAACITYACHTGYSDTERHVIVYDFGGGTLDVSLVKIKGDDFTVVATSGDSHCGGDDIDQHICQQKIKEIKQKFGVDISAPDTEDMEDKYSRHRARLLHQCEQAKISLSASVNRIEINIPSFIDGKDFISNVSKSDIENYVESNREKLAGPIKLVFKEAEKKGIKKDKITDNILVGGSSRIPAIRKLVGEEIGKTPYMLLDPDEAIATGAAIYGACKLKKRSIKGFSEFKIQDVTPMAIGIGIRSGKVDIQIPRNTPIPCTSKWIRYRKEIKRENIEDRITLPIYEGDSDETRYCHYVGKFDIIIKTKDHPDPVVIIYARINVTSDGITVHATVSDEPPTGEDYKKEQIKTDQLVHTEGQIIALRNQIKDWLSIVEINTEIVYHQRLVKVLVKIDSCKNSITKDAKLSKSIKDAINEIRKEVTSKYGDNNKMTKEEFESYIKRAEDAIRAIIPDYERPEVVQKEIDGIEEQ
jgi:heat shock protein 1/8